MAGFAGSDMCEAVGTEFLVCHDHTRISGVMMAENYKHDKIQSHEWYTPKSFMDTIHQAIPIFDIDACCPNTRGERTHVKAKKYLTSCLDVDWNGLVWMNPPYNDLRNHWVTDGEPVPNKFVDTGKKRINKKNGKPQTKYFDKTPPVTDFLRKAITECDKGNCDAVLVLIPNNHEVKWWSEYVNQAPIRLIFRLQGRIPFDYGGHGDAPMAPNRQYSLIMYVSKHAPVIKIKQIAGRLFLAMLESGRIYPKFERHIKTLMHDLAAAGQTKGFQLIEHGEVLSEGAVPDMEFTPIDEPALNSNITTDEKGFVTHIKGKRIY